jgi:hypothetical protein
LKLIIGWFFAGVITSVLVQAARLESMWRGHHMISSQWSLRMRGSTIMMFLLLAIAAMWTLAPPMPPQAKLLLLFKPMFTDMSHHRFTTAWLGLSGLLHLDPSACLEGSSWGLRLASHLEWINLAWPILQWLA